MFELTGRDRITVPFAGDGAGTEPLTWGQKAILQDMRASGNQFSMGGRFGLPEGSTEADAAARLSGLMSRHPALRMRLRTGEATQEVAGSGQTGLDIVTVPDDASEADIARYAASLMDTWPLERFDFHHDWPLRMALIRQRGACLHLVWALSHLAADGGAHVLLLDDLIAAGTTGQVASSRPRLLDIARSEQQPQLRQLSARTMRYWETQLRDLPAQTFGEPVPPGDQTAPRYWQARFSSAAAHLAMLAIAQRTGTDASRVTLAIIATAIGRVTGMHPVRVKVMMNNRFRPGLASVIAPIAQNSAVSIDVADAAIDEVVARARGASVTAGMRAYYDPDDLQDLTGRLDAERGYPAQLTCRVNDQRAMTMRTGPDAAASGDAVTPAQLRQRRDETTLTWIGPRDNMHEQVSILVENRPGVVSLHMMWDRWSLTDELVEALLRAVEEVAVEAAFDPAAPTRVRPATVPAQDRPGSL